MCRINFPFTAYLNLITLENFVLNGLFFYIENKFKMMNNIFKSINLKVKKKKGREYNYI